MSKNLKLFLGLAALALVGWWLGEKVINTLAAREAIDKIWSIGR